MHSTYCFKAVFLLKFSLVLLLSLAFACQVSALEVPQLKARVNDYANIISTTAEDQLEQILQKLEQSDSTQIAVLTIPSLEGENLEQFALKTVEKWKLGQAGFDNGALLLVAVNDKKVRIETGYGLEGSLTDLVAGRIIRNDVLPQFKQGNFTQGILSGVTGMAQAVKGEYSQEDRASNTSHDDPFGFLAALMFFFFFIGNIFRKSKTLSAVVGGIAAPFAGTLFFGYSLPLIAALIPVGLVLGLIASSLVINSGGHGRSPYRGGGFGGFGGGGSFGGGGGFSGGGGGFGGGGASGGW